MSIKKKVVEKIIHQDDKELIEWLLKSLKSIEHALSVIILQSSSRNGSSWTQFTPPGNLRQ